MSFNTSSMGWLKTNLGSVIELNYGKSLPAKTRDGGEFPVFGSNGVVGNHSQALVKEPGIVVGRKGSFGEVQFSDKPFYPIDTTYYIDQFHGQPVRYWYYQLVFLPLNQLNRSTAIPGLNREDAYAQDITLPPLAEQKVIADKLDTLLAQVDTTKARLERIPEILKRFRQSVLAAAVSGRLTEQWRENKTHTSEPSIKELEAYWENIYSVTGKKRPQTKEPHLKEKIDIPNDWLDTTIGAVFDVFVGSTPSRSVIGYWNGDIHWVSSSEVAFCHIRSTKEKITGSGLLSASTSIHPPGTVMLAMIGQGKTRGQVAILDIDACHNQNTAALRVPEGFVASEYLYYYLTQQYEETRRIGGGNNQKALNKKVIQAMRFPMPSPEEQTEIVRRVDQLFAYADTVERQVNSALERVNQLTQSILAKAFRGELTAQWRADNFDLISGENSAEALLERIKAERAAQAPTKRTRKKATA